MSESERPGGRRVALLSETEQLEMEESVEGLRGGSGGRGLGGDSKLISGAETIGAERAAVGLQLVALGGGVFVISRKPFRCLPLRAWCETADGGPFGPSSTIQSFRSIDEVFRPRFGGDGDGDLLKDFCGVNGTIG